MKNLYIAGKWVSAADGGTSQREEGEGDAEG